MNQSACFHGMRGREHIGRGLSYQSEHEREAEWCPVRQKSVSQGDMLEPQGLKSCFSALPLGEFLLLMPEVTMLFFYTMAFRWRPCLTLLFPNKSFVICKEVPEIYLPFFFSSFSERNILKLFYVMYLSVMNCFFFFPVHQNDVSFFRRVRIKFHQ